MPTFPEGPTSTVGFVDVGDINSPYVLHDLRDTNIRTLLCHQQMDVVGHQAIGMKLHIISFAALSQRVQVISVILVSKETSITVITALDDMCGDPRQLHPWFSWHRKSFCGCCKD
jgi:hypothetical protein